MAAKFIIRRPSAAGSTDEPPLAEQTFDGPMATIGSDQAATIQLRGHGIAPEQAVIVNEDGQLLLINQADGTTLNQETLAREAIRPLTHGDRLRVGEYVIEILLEQTAQAGQTTESIAPPSAENLPATPITQAAPPTPPDRVVSQRSFASILDSLRTEEDSFYFTVQDGVKTQRRIQIDSAEMPLGWDDTGQSISCDPALIVAPRGVVRKDWSGVVVQAAEPSMISVNEETVETVRRLRNGDRVSLLPTAIHIDPEQHFLIFHEPASLIVLDSLLPQKLPPPVAVGNSGEQKSGQGATTLPARLSPDAAPIKTFDLHRKYFGYFTLLELLVMGCGTIIAAVIIFLILEYS